MSTVFSSLFCILFSTLQARALATATSQMVHSLRDEAQGLSDKSAQDRLLQGAKALAEATARMVAAAKTAATNPADEDAQAALRKATDDLRNAVNSAAGDNLRKRVSPLFTSFLLPDIFSIACYDITVMLHCSLV